MRIIMWCLSFVLLIICWFAYIESFLHWWAKSRLIMVYGSFNVSLNSVNYSFVKGFCICIHDWYWPVIYFFLVVSFSGFHLWVMLASELNIEHWIYPIIPSWSAKSADKSVKTLFLQLGGNSLRRIDVNFPLNVWQKFISKVTQSWTSVYWEFFYYSFNFISSNCSVSIFIYSWFNLRRFMFLGIYSLLLGCPVCWYITVCTNLFWYFLFLWCLITSGLLGPFLFFTKKNNIFVFYSLQKLKCLIYCPYYMYTFSREIFYFCMFFVTN